MKIRILHIVPMVLAALALPLSCSDEMSDLRKPQEKEITFIVNISVPNNLPSSKAIDDFGVDDNQVDVITILLFDPATGLLKEYAETTAITDVSPTQINFKRFTVQIPFGTYDALFITNSSAYIAGVCDLTNKVYISGGAPITKSTIETALQYSILAGTKYNANPASAGYWPFRMCSPWINNLSIPTTVTYDVNHPIPLRRMVAKINVNVDPTVASKITLSEILLCNYNRSAWVVPAPGLWTSTAPLFAPSGVTRPTLPETGTIGSSLGNPISYTRIGGEIKTPSGQPPTSPGIGGECIDEIFTYEAPISAVANENPCLIIRATNVTVGSNTYISDRYYKLDFRYPDPDDSNIVKRINILRNFSYNLTINDVQNAGYDTAQEAYDNEAEGLLTYMTVFDDPDGLYETVWGPSYHLSVDRSIKYFYWEGGTDILKVFTDNTVGWKIGSITYEPGASGWLSTPSPDQTSSANTTAPTSVTLTATQNLGPKPRIASFIVSTGSLQKKITVIQFPKASNVTDDLPTAVDAYVGAYWRAEQYGERLIRISRPTTVGYEDVIDGEWMAVVLEGKDWIIMDTQPTLDPNVGWLSGSPNEAFVVNGNDPGFDAAYFVNSVATMVNGTLRPSSAPGYHAGDENIYFRLGAKTSISSAQVRYGVVLLFSQATGRTHRIWLRQGHVVDYLMRPQDYNSSSTGWGSPNPRPMAVKFSPYNLTAASLNTAVDAKGATPSGNPGIFTAYPSQAGAVFQWINTGTATRFAFDAITSPGAPSGWNTTYNNTDYWTNGHPTLSSVHETCPPNFSRPTDGPTDSPNTAGATTGSAVRQSLWLDPPTAPDVFIGGNTSYGYYADGFFDRRLIVSNLDNSLPNASVSKTNNNIAHTGTIFFNTNNCASLFFPHAGYRASSTGSFGGSTGVNAAYWTSSSYDTNSPWLFRAAFMGTSLGHSNPRSTAASIRCVECIPMGGLSVFITGYTPPYTFAAGSRVTISSSLTNPNASTVNYQWQTSEDGINWIDIPGASNTPSYAAIVSFGLNYFRLVATNCDGTYITELQPPIDGTMPPGGGDEPNIQLYIGAFWRDTEKGERVIRFNVGTSDLNNHGEWIATVAEYDSQWDEPNNDGVVLANGPSTAPGMYTNSPSNPELYPVPGTLRTIRGNVAAGGTIEFRIGCEKTFSAYDINYGPARYAVVLLMYGTSNSGGAKVQKMFLRQGQGDDYVMRSSDLLGGATRANVNKFSPFNICDPSGSAPNNYNQATNLGTNGGTFVDYPTKAGYFFVFGTGTKGFAPDNPTTSVNAWNQNIVTPGTWSTADETCPTGYRRPYDALPDNNAYTNPPVSGSEIRQSLWLNPPSGTGSSIDNSVWGYYADGYFDRRAIVTSLGTTNTATSAVNTSNVNVAYVGRLFFNPTTHASLFFPAAGYRYWQNGTLYNAGGTGSYFTKTTYSISPSTNDAWALEFTASTGSAGPSNTATMGFDIHGNQSSKTEGRTVRCVRNIPLIL